MCLRTARQSALFALASTILLAANLAAQQTKVLAPHRPIPPRVNKKIDWSKSATRRSMVGGLWMTDANFKSSIYLRSVVETDSVTVTPILRLANGTKYTLPDVTLEPAGIAIIDINAGLQSKGISYWATLSGYVELQYTWPWDPLCATVRDIDVSHSLIFTYGLQPSGSSASQADTADTTQQARAIEGMWWKQESNITGFVALANTSSQPIQAVVQIGDHSAKSLAQHTVTVSPHGMKLVNLSELPQIAGSEGSLRVTYTGPADALILNGGLEDQSVGYSAALAFASPPIQTSQLPAHAKTSEFTSLAELGLMAGAADPMMSFPAGTTFTPYSILRNVSDALVSVTPTIWWMQSGAAQSARLPQVQLQPYESESLNVNAMLALAGLKNYNGSFNIVFDGDLKRGSLLTAAGSVDQTYTYVFEVRPRGIAESASKSLQYWSTGNGDDTMITLWNPTDEAQDLVFKLIFSGGHYLLPVHLEPRATRTINVSEVTMNPAPDAEGNTIPASIHEGSARITGSHANNEHILVAIDAGVYNVRKATCGLECYTCDGYSNYAMDPTSFVADVDATTKVSFVADYNDGSQYDLSADAVWQSSNTSVGTVNDIGLVTGVALGSLEISANDSIDPVYVAELCDTSGDPCPVGDGGGGGAAGHVYDPTPSITSISNQPWPAGTTTSFTITGTGFGTSPTLAITGTGITSSSIVGTPTDTSINASVTIASSAPSESATVTVNSGGFNGSGFQGQSGQSGSGSAEAQVINNCPTSTSINSSTAEVLTSASTYKTGYGEYVGIAVSPSAPTGTVVTENLSNVTNSCPTGFPNVCTTSSGLNSSSLVVGAAGTTLNGTNLLATPNIMWDEHALRSTSNLLGSSGKSCTIQCGQQFTCAGAVIGNYTITFTFTAGTISGTPVTKVTASTQ
jgi:Bacterial Ig-like domain (group 2)